MIPLICIDVDGTLVGASGVPTARVWAATAAAVDRGQHLALSTARGAFGPAADFARRLDFSGWHVFHAGAAIVNFGTDQRCEHELPPEVIEVAEAAAAARNWVLEYYTASDYAIDSDAELAVAHAGLLGVAHRRRAVTALDGGIVRVQFVVDVADASDVAAEMARGPATAVTAATSPVMPGSAFVSVIADGISKATAIGEIASRLGVTMEEVMMVGDGHNDLEAIIAVGHGVAMGNAEPEVLAAARHVVGTVNDDGLAEALELSSRL